MRRFHLKKGLDIPISGAPRQIIETGTEVRQVALLGRDYVGLRPSMAVKVGDDVVLGQLLFRDKRGGAQFTSPGCGKVSAIHRGAKRKFQSIVIDLAGDERREFPGVVNKKIEELDSEEIRETLISSGMWTAFRTRPFGRVPSVESMPTSLFVTAIDSSPLAAEPALIIKEKSADFSLGMAVMRGFFPSIYLCSDGKSEFSEDLLTGLTHATFSGPHPAGLASTHIHFLDPVSINKMVWHIGYQDIIAIGALFRSGRISPERVVSLAGPGVEAPALVRTRLGANLTELSQGRLKDGALRLLSGSILDGDPAKGVEAYLGRYHQQVCAIPEKTGRGLLGWLRPGGDRFSSLPVFTSALQGKKAFLLGTAAWGGHRAIFPVSAYEKVMPMDIVAIPLLKSIVNGDHERAQELGCLELVEEDLALCSFVCPGKNDFGPHLRDLLTQIENEQD